jgi:hypothetical protein
MGIDTEQYGYPKGTYERNELLPRKGHTAEMKDINEQHPGFWKQMSIQDACNSYANMGHCSCKGNCETLARFVCRVAGRRCTSLCHEGRGNKQIVCYV